MNKSQLIDALAARYEGNRKAAARMGFRAATTLQDALEMASGTVGTSPSITYLHNPPHLLADVR